MELNTVENANMDEIHDIIGRNAELNRQICDRILDYDFDNNDDLIFHLFRESKKMGNPYATYQIAMWYKDGVYLEQSDDLYELYLNMTLAQIEEIYKGDDPNIYVYNEDQDDIIKIETIRPGIGKEYSGLVRDASFRLGLYAYSSYDNEGMKKAERLFSDIPEDGSDNVTRIRKELLFRKYFNAISKGNNNQ